MTRKIGVTHDDLEELTAKAVALSAWLDTELAAIKNGETRIPPELTTLGVGALTLGASLFLAKELPTMLCWGGPGGCSA